MHLNLFYHKYYMTDEQQQKIFHFDKMLVATDLTRTHC